MEKGGDCCSDWDCNLDDVRKLPDPNYESRGKPVCWYAGGDFVGEVDWSKVAVSTGLYEPAQAVRACGGNTDGAKQATCKFPMTYKGVEYNQCIGDNHNEPWCFTDDSGSNWGNCNCAACGTYSSSSLEVVDSTTCPATRCHWSGAICESPPVVSKPAGDDNLIAYWDLGACGPHGDDYQWDWCDSAAFQCKDQVATTHCSSGYAKLVTTYGDGTCCSSVNIDGCDYAYFAQYQCSDYVGSEIDDANAAGDWHDDDWHDDDYHDDDWHDDDFSYGGALNRKHAMGMEKKAIGSKLAWHSSFPFSSIMIVLSFAGVTFMCLRIGCATRRFRTLTRTMDAEERESYSTSLQGRAPYTMVDIDECELDSVMEPMGSNPKPSEVIGECYAPVCTELNDGYEDLLVPTENIPGTTEEFIPASQRVRAWQNVLRPDEPCSSRQPLLGTDDTAELTDCESRDVSERRVFGI